MSYRQSDIKKINRLITLLLRFDAAPASGINLQHFAVTADVNIRTVQRDVKLLNECLSLAENKKKIKEEFAILSGKETGIMVLKRDMAWPMPNKKKFFMILLNRWQKV